MLSRVLLSRLWAVARRDDVFAGALGSLTLVAALVHGLPWPQVVAGVALSLPLGWRTRQPLAVLALVICGAVASLAFAGPFPAYVLPVTVATYTVAARGGRRRTLAVGAALVPVGIAVVLAFSPDEGGPVRQTLQVVSQLWFALAVGEAVRSQRAFIGAMRERAERAEHEHELEAQRRVDEERVRIAREVHDVVAHSLATVSTQASVGVHIGREEPERAVEVLQAIKEVSTSALQDLRYALGALREDADAPTGPTPSLQELPELVDRARSSGLSIVLRMEGSPAVLPAALQVAVYRIVQEGLTNVMRHAAG
ncbi:MAG: two-component sensor histidine kinase, partial [Solirubrobacterales bacterium]|nr:two-component sensor histidine kinase [Solirubrobacterales bacterium]